MLDGRDPDFDPYRPPAAADSGVSPGFDGTQTGFDYRPVRGRVRLATAGMILWASTNAIALWASARQLDLLGRMSSDAYREAEVWANERRMQLAGMGRMVALVLVAVAFLVVLVRASRNARALGATDMSHSPASAVFWFAVPIANLWRPYQVVRELWLASTPRPGGPWSQARVSPLLPAWWAAWLAFVASEWIARRSGGRTPQMGDVLTATRVELVACVLGFIAAGLAVRLMWALAWRQEERARLFQATAATGAGAAK